MVILINAFISDEFYWIKRGEIYEFIHSNNSKRYTFADTVATFITFYSIWIIPNWGNYAGVAPKSDNRNFNNESRGQIYFRRCESIIVVFWRRVCLRRQCLQKCRGKTSPGENAISARQWTRCCYNGHVDCVKIVGFWPQRKSPFSLLGRHELDGTICRVMALLRGPIVCDPPKISRPNNLMPTKT